MASWQAHLAAWFLKRRIKPRLTAALTEPCDLDTLRRVLRVPAKRLPRGVRITRASVGGVPGEWVQTDSSHDLTLLYLHGGGYFACSPKTHRAITIAFAREGFRVFAPDYRLAPEHRFPAALEDAVAVYRSLCGDVPADKILVAGDSAGGGLTLALLVALRDAGEALPAGAALFSPWTDLAGTGDSLVANRDRCAVFDGTTVGSGARLYLGKGDPRNPLASPIYADLAHLPPLLIHAGRDEVLLDDSTRVAERAKAAGVPCQLKIWPVVPHAWQIGHGFLPEARESLHEAAVFLANLTKDRNEPN